jgi:plastocyanin
VVDEVVFAKPAAGTYFFRCDVHPTIMTGNFIVGQ